MVENSFSAYTIVNCSQIVPKIIKKIIYSCEIF